MHTSIADASWSYLVPQADPLAGAELIRSEWVVSALGSWHDHVERERREVMMASEGTQPATNERILRLVQEVQAELADAKKRERQIARDLQRLLDRK